MECSVGAVYLVVFPLKSAFLQVLWVEIDGQRPVLAWEVIRVLGHVFLMYSLVNTTTPQTFQIVPQICQGYVENEAPCSNTGKQLKKN